MSRFLFLCLFFPLFASQAQTQADFYTSLGNFRVELREDLMPITANNFITLARKGYYDATIFHRVVADFVIQGGDPSATGSGGPGYTIMDEYHVDMTHDSAGVIAMAKTNAPNSAGSQFYFTLTPQPNLDGRYSVFGSCIQGLQVILDIGKVPVNGNDRPLTAVILDSVRVINTTSIDQEDLASISLEISPNPFTKKSVIRYEVQQPSELTITIFDMQGNQVKLLQKGLYMPGVHEVPWDGVDVQGNTVSAGIYRVLVSGAQGVARRKLVKY